ncbi:MAG: deoxyribonuclease IV [Fimbriimonadia bacterium]
MKRLIGAHMPTAKGMAQALHDGKAIGCDCVQVFTTTPMQWRGKSISEEDAAAFRAAVPEAGLGAVASHAIYLLNLASPDPELLEKSRTAYLQELERCRLLGIPQAVVHVGKHMDSGEDVGVQTLSESIRAVLAESPKEVAIAMETDAGQGTCIGHHFEQLASVLDANKGHKRLTICLDTCHIFVAGYDIRTAEAFSKVLDDFDRVIGLDRLTCLHANDAKKPLGSRVDRHAHIGDGEIGMEAFRFLVNEPRLAHVPIYIETPEMETMHEENVRRLKSLLA